MKDSGRFRVALVEPSAIVATGISTVLSQSGGYEVAGVIPENNYIGERLRMLDPDIVILNPSIVDRGRTQSVRVQYPFLQECLLVGIAYELYPETLLKQFDAVITIHDEPRQIIRKLRTAMDEKTGAQDTAISYELSEREKEILISVAKGATNKEIASRHNISVHTVISHRKNITRKTGIKTVSALTIYAVINGLIDISDSE
ncbi:MAG: LuxR C-terminal-related transcriptional regulator [Rikenellaceae bacterium]|nr:LuxR C-terminal-related transcriptional regulator [Rikenellaceae bacterium]